MPKDLLIDKRAMLCPGCGYDLRGAPRREEGLRCPECGKVWGLREVRASRLPWAQRRWRGRVRSFLATAWMVVAQPKLLARELEVPAQPREARRFRLICELLATIIGTAWLMGAMRLLEDAGPMNSDAWWVIPILRFPAIVPAYLLLDHWYGAVPVAVGAFLATRVCVELYRAMLWVGVSGERFRRQRMAALGHYSVGLVLVETVLLGAAWFLIVADKRIALAHHEGPATTLALAIVCAAAVAAYLSTTVGFMMQHAPPIFRALLVVAYPVIAYLVWIAVVTAVCWGCGYLVLGLRSMAN